MTQQIENLQHKNLACLWLREDLRIKDHPGFYQAQSQGKSCVALYCITPKTWEKQDRSDRQIAFILETLKNLKQELALLNIPLKILLLDYFEEIPQALAKFCKQFFISEVFASYYYGVDEKIRDQQAEKVLSEQGVKIYFCHDFPIFSPKEILKPDGQPYQVFTAYQKAWIQKALKITWGVYPMIQKQEKLNFDSDEIPDLNLKAVVQDWVLSSENLNQKLNIFLDLAVDDYQKNRDFPYLNQATSHLSTYLAQGVISVRSVIYALLQQKTKTGDFTELLKQEGVSCFLSELIWRDFYQMILFHYPRVSKHRAFKLDTEKIHWENNGELFKAWCEGRTGFPIVDAAMRCLNQTGWMHNRLRMVVAMFLTKILLIDWRWGEAYFMKNLIDGELAANNGGWQWCASTGTDAAPYFRIFNPVLQSQKFDPKGLFITQYIPELKNLSAKEIHAPSELTCQTTGYTRPIVNYAERRQRVLALFKKI